MKIDRNNIFKKRFKKLPTFIQKKTIARLLLFEEDSKNILLNNHKLTGKYKGCRSINITGDYRAIYKEMPEDTYLFIELGTHHQLYGK